jgi:hypothetical protein
MNIIDFLIYMSLISLFFCALGLGSAWTMFLVRSSKNEIGTTRGFFYAGLAFLPIILILLEISERHIAVTSLVCFSLILFDYCAFLILTVRNVIGLVPHNLSEEFKVRLVLLFVFLICLGLSIYGMQSPPSGVYWAYISDGDDATHKLWKVPVQVNEGWVESILIGDNRYEVNGYEPIIEGEVYATSLNGRIWIVVVPFLMERGINSKTFRNYRNPTLRALLAE